jgi:dolichyl-phosphate beta-glucosyltransferase
VVGWVLLLVVALMAVWLIFRRVAALALVIAGLMLVWLSVGPTPVFDSKQITWWPVGPQGLWTHLQNLPLFSSSLPIRSAIAVSWIIGILLAMGLDEAVRHRWLALRGAACAAVAVALVPLLPRVFDTTPRAPIPDYFTSSAWKECVSPSRDTIIGVPLSDGGDRTNLTWSTAADTGFAIPQGPFMAPFSTTDKQVTWSTPDGNMLWTAHWLKYIYDNGGGATPPVDGSIRSLVRLDLKQWQANCVVAADGSKNLTAIKSFLDQAIAPGVLEGGVVVWKEPVG